jgi:hypothetical protein
VHPRGERETVGNCFERAPAQADNSGVAGGRCFCFYRQPSVLGHGLEAVYVAVLVRKMRDHGHRRADLPPRCRFLVDRRESGRVQGVGRARGHGETDDKQVVQACIDARPGLRAVGTLEHAVSLVNGVRGGPLGLTLGANQTEEATIITSTSGQFGGGAGGNINYVTKSGGNAFHGNAQYYWNGTVLNANDWFMKADGNPRPLSNAA